MVPLDLVQAIENSVSRFEIDSVFLEVGLNVHVRVIPLDSKCIFHEKTP
jgi:hypothetical protein